LKNWRVAETTTACLTTAGVIAAGLQSIGHIVLSIGHNAVLAVTQIPVHLEQNDADDANDGRHGQAERLQMNYTNPAKSGAEFA
jgi:hypothetical protein